MSRHPASAPGKTGELESAQPWPRALGASEGLEDGDNLADASVRDIRADLAPPHADENRLPVLRPQLPTVERLLPYLRLIDATRVYANRGLLLRMLERRLADLLKLNPGSVITTNSGTTAIIACILATAGRASAEKPLAIIPAFTFVATAAAAQQCGYEPHLADVDGNNWMLDARRLIDHPRLHKVGVVVPVAPFGRPVPQAPWLEFQRRTGIPVVIDAAASFDMIIHAPDAYLGDIPVAISFHATKCFGVGEGGALAVASRSTALRAARILNFGFQHTRNSHFPSMNGKMSEHTAAVGLAELDGWAAKYTDLSNVMRSYRHAMEEAQLSQFLCVHPDISTTYALLVCRSPQQAMAAERALDQHNIDCRRWYGTGVQDQSYFAISSRDRLDTTHDVLPCLIGLPVAPDLSQSDIQRVVEALRPVLSN